MGLSYAFSTTAFSFSKFTVNEKCPLTDTGKMLI